MDDLQRIYDLIEKLDIKIDNLSNKLENNADKMAKFSEKIAVAESNQKSCQEKQNTRFENVSGQIYSHDQRLKVIEDNYISKKDIVEKSKNSNTILDIILKVGKIISYVIIGVIFIYVTIIKN